MSDTSRTLKRKGSANQGFSTMKQPRTAVQSFVPKPNEADIRVPGKLTVEKLRIIMELDIHQFKEITGVFRSLAKETLDINATLASQDKDKWNKYVAKACEHVPLLLTKYAEAWPVEAYMNLYLYTRVVTSRNAVPSVIDSTSKRVMSSVDQYKPSSASQSLIPRPSNEAQLSHLCRSKMNDLREAMGFDYGEFRQMSNCLRVLAVKHLDIDVTLSEQPQAKWLVFEREALKAKPFLSTKFEGAWPLHIYMDRYLAKRFSRQNPDQSSQEGDSSDMAMADQPSEVPCEVEAKDTEKTQNTTSPSLSPSPTTVLSSSNVALSDTTKVLTPRVQTPLASVAPDTTSVLQFLRSLDPNLEHLFDLFVTLGIRDDQTLDAFKRLTKENRRSLLQGRLNELQLLGLEIYFESA